MKPARIAIPAPTSADLAYNERCWTQYAAAVTGSGGLPVFVDLALEPGAIAELAATCAGVLLPGSPADVEPEKYGESRLPSTGPADALRGAADELLLQDGFNLHKPIFGICYGHQSLNVWKGGKLLQQVPSGTVHDAGASILEAHDIVLSARSTHLRAAFDGQPLRVNSSHHQAVWSVGDGLVEAARSGGDLIVEACEGARGFVVGVQWHPERTWGTHVSSQRLFSAFVRAAEQWQE